MANKTYAVLKDGEELNVYKLFPAAKKLADAEGAVVFCDGVSVYKSKQTAEAAAIDLHSEETTEPAGHEIGERKTADRFRLTSLMNVRSSPSLTAPILGTKRAGTVVTAIVENDWLRLTDNTFILYSEGRYAVRI